MYRGLSRRFSMFESIKRARKSFTHIYNDKLETSIGDMWSIKKFLLLDYYMPAFISIVRNNNFTKFYYADLFCGSGKLSNFEDSILKNESFPGSALIGALNASSLGYTDCILSDIKQKYVESLNTRLENSKYVLGGISYRAYTMDFKTSVEKILEIKKFRVAILVLIDPAAYVPIKWDLMKALSKEVGIDIIFNFYTQGIAHNVSASKTDATHERNLNEFFGDESWKKVRDGSRSSLGDKLLNLYIQKLRMASGKNVIEIGVYKRGEQKLYDLIVVTRSTAGAKVIKKAKEVMSLATTTAITREFKAQVTSQKRLFD